MTSDYDEDIDWNKVMEKEAMGENGLDLGTIKQIEEEYIITEMGGLTKKRYKLPKSAVKSFNGVFLNFLLNETDVSAFMLKEDNMNMDTDSSIQSVESGVQKEEEEETLVPLIGEDLNVTKKITEDNVKISKEPLRETKTIQITLMHEKITAEKIAIGSNANTYNSKSKSVTSPNNRASLGDETDYDKEPAATYSKVELLIPVKREEPVITKRSFVKEEIVVKKKPVTETKNISEEVINEEMEYVNTTE
jgi:stress response protein YsnF